jgi:formylmethanofuran dehydrogenase subunit E
MRDLEELLRESSTLHGHSCAGQVVGVRMAMVGCREVDIDEPKGCKKLVVSVEIDRCATDAIQAVTGCSLGRRTLKFFDYGKMAATFTNLETRKAVRVLARDEARMLASAYCPQAASPAEAQKRAYAMMPERDLFSVQAASVALPEENMPGFRGARVYCDNCGEGINFRREVYAAGRTLCIPCAASKQDFKGGVALQAEKTPPVVLIVGFKKVGKTRLMEKLVGELSARGYRIACVKHHHCETPVIVDACGTDTWRFRKAGAKSVALLTPNHLASFQDTSEQPSLQHVLRGLAAYDLVLGEGFHNEAYPKIEVLAADRNDRLCRRDENLIAVVKENEGEETVPTLTPEDSKSLADFIEARFLHPAAGQFS